MKKLLFALALLALLAGGAFHFLRGAVAETAQAGLKAFPVYSFVRTRNEQLARIAHALGPAEPDALRPRGLGLLVHRDRLATPRDRSVTTPNTDTLYSSAFLDFGEGWEVEIPAVTDRYISVAVMDARTDHAVIAGTRDGTSEPQRLMLLNRRDCKPSQQPGGPRIVCVPTDEAWLLVRVEMKGPDDLEAARAVQRAVVLNSLPVGYVPAPWPAIRPVILPVAPDPKALLERANPVIARHPGLQDPELARTGYGGADGAFDALPWWRQWLWRMVWPRVVARMQAGIAAGSRTTADGWSMTPPGIGTADASDATRAGVALGGLAALPADEAIYWTATQDADGAELDGAGRYRLRIPQPVPARAFWSVTLYERLPDGRLFFADNPLNRYAIGNRTPGLKPGADGSLSITIAATDPGGGTTWLPAPASGPFTLIFRAYLPEPAFSRGEWRLPPVERLP